jgi:hypothetical protein
MSESITGRYGAAVAPVGTGQPRAKVGVLY